MSARLSRCAAFVFLISFASCSTSSTFFRRGARGPAEAPCSHPVTETTGSQHVPICVLGGDERSFFPDAGSAPIDDGAKYDVIVVGAGLSGLMAAVYLTDHRKTVLVLEKEEEVGGLASSGSSSDGILYDRGAAYWTDTYKEEYNLLRHIGIESSAKRFKIPEPIDSYLWNGKLYAGVWDDETLARLPASFALFKRELELANKHKLIPNQPFEEFESRYGGKMDLDSMDAATWMRSMPRLAAGHHDSKTSAIYARFKEALASGKLPANDPMADVVHFLDLYCRSALGSDASDVSAMAFANFYISEIVPRYTTELGTAKAAWNMKRMLGERPSLATIRTSSPVARIRDLGGRNGVEVTYVAENSPGRAETHRVHARYVVFAAQLGVAPKAIDGLAEFNTEQARLMSELGYSHYSVHNVEVQGHPYREAYDTWSRPSDYTEDDFTDVILGRWIELKGYAETRDFATDPAGNGIFTIYHPLPRGLIGSGYTDLQAAQIADRAVNRLIDVFSPAMKELDPSHGPKSDIRLIDVKTSRWPFSVHIARPGHFAHDAAILRKPYGNIFFGNNNLGTPAFEEALFRGHCAADNVLARMESDFRPESWSRCPIDP